MNSRHIRTLLLLSLALLAAGACRSRTKPVEPKTTPPPTTTEATMPTVPVTKQPDPRSDSDDDAIFRAEIDELNREARRRGWLQDAFFPFDESRLDVNARNAIDRSARFLRERPEFNLLIEGHCDERGTEQYNLALGDRRASAVREHLVAAGIDEERIRVVSYGEERPFATESNESAWAQNRRAHLVLVRPR